MRRLLAVLTLLLLSVQLHAHDGELPEVIPNPDAFPKGAVDVPRRPGDATPLPPSRPTGPVTGPIDGPLPGPEVPRPNRPDRPDIPKRNGQPRPGVDTASPDHWFSWWLLNRERFVLLSMRREASRKLQQTAASPHFFGEGSPRNRSGEPAREHIEAALAVLLLCASDSNSHVATSAIIALGKTGDARALAPLTDIAVDRNRRREERESALLAIGMLGPAGRGARPLLTKVLDDAGQSVGDRVFAACGLGLLGDPAVLPVLLRRAVAKESRRDVPAACLLAGGMAGGDFTVPDYSRLLSGNPASRFSDARLRALAAAALARTGSREAVPALRRAIRDREMLVQRQAVLSLGAICGPEDEAVVTELIRLLAYEGDSVLRGLTALALGEIGSPAGADSLLYMLRKGDSVEVQFAALALGLLVHSSPSPELGDKVVPVLRYELTSTKNSGFKGALAIALGLGRDPDSAKLLAGMYEDENDVWLKGRLATAMALIGDDSAREPLRRALVVRGDHRIVIDAAFALGALADLPAIKILTERLAASNSEYARGAAALALGYVLTPEGCRVLVDLLADRKTSDSTRTMAALALGRILSKNPVPVLSRYGNHLAPGVVEGTLGSLLKIW
jgi:HEAT repeat protein